FDALGRAVEAGVLTLVEERFFRNRLRLDSFAQFEKGIIQATHTVHDLSPQVYDKVRETFELNRAEAGYVFDIPNRIDLLRKG
ncbi:MAG: SAM-dependent methyltransferase, partial [Pseudomonadota bacterium]